jgi:hypothetical protein
MGLNSEFKTLQVLMTLYRSPGDKDLFNYLLPIVAYVSH